MSNKHSTGDELHSIAQAAVTFRDIAERYRHLKPLMSVLKMGRSEIDLASKFLLDVEFNFIDWIIFKLLLMEIEIVVTISGYIIYRSKNVLFTDDQQFIRGFVDLILTKYGFYLKRTQSGDFNEGAQSALVLHTIGQFRRFIDAHMGTHQMEAVCLSLLKETILAAEKFEKVIVLL